MKKSNEQSAEQQQKKKKNILIGCGALIVITILIVIGIGTCLGGETGETTPSATVGSEAVISAPNLDKVYLAIDNQAFDEWIKAANAKDYIGMAQMEALGKVFVVPNGTKVLVIDRSMFSRKVRILEGSAYGRSGWLPYEWVK